MDYVTSMTSLVVQSAVLSHVQVMSFDEHHDDAAQHIAASLAEWF